MVHVTRQQFVGFVGYCWAFIGARALKLRKWLDGFIGPITSDDELVAALAEEHARAERWKARYQKQLKWTCSVDSFWKGQYETLKAGNDSTLAWQDVQIEGLAESLRKALAELAEVRNELAVVTLREVNRLNDQTIPGPAAVRLPIRSWDEAEAALLGGVSADDIMQADIN